MYAWVQMALPDGRDATLYAGHLIGRTGAAALRVDLPEVSEAHALISLRGERLWLLALRRRFRVNGQPQDAVPLSVGLSLELVPGFPVRVTALHLPAEVLGLEGPGLPAQALLGTCGLVFDPHPRLVSGTPPGAAAHFWAMEGRWRARVGGAAPRALEPGTTVVIEGQTFRAVNVPLGHAGEASTLGGERAPLHLVTFHDTVQIHREHHPTVQVVGQLARVISELASVGQPLAWDGLARPLWPHIDEREVLRKRWDGLLGRLRERLRADGLPEDLVRSTRVGLVELVLQPGDVVDDRA